MGVHVTDPKSEVESITTDPTDWGKIKMKFLSF